jgi:hypothetical protein
LARRERWGLSSRGWLVAVSGFALAGILFLFKVHPFLAVTHPVQSNVFVVDDCVHPQTIDGDFVSIQHLIIAPLSAINIGKMVFECCRPGS